MKTRLDLLNAIKSLALQAHLANQDDLYNVLFALAFAAEHNQSDSLAEMVLLYDQDVLRPLREEKLPEPKNYRVPANMFASSTYANA